MLLDINNDVFGVIFFKLDLRDKCSLGLTNKTLSKMIYGESTNRMREESEHITSSLSEYLVDDELERRADECGLKLSIRDGDIKRSAVMQLLFGKGCMFCAKKRIRKVYQPFNIRCCIDCLYDRTVSSYALNTLYGVSDRAMMRTFKDIPFMPVEKFNPNSSYYRYYTMHFYWIETVERVIFQGQTLQEVGSRVQRQKDHEESIKRREKERQMNEILEKKRARTSKIREYISEMGEDIENRPQTFKDALMCYMDKTLPPPTKKAFMAKWKSLSR